MPLSSHIINCVAGAGGVKRFAVAERKDIDTLTVGPNGDVTALTMVATKLFYLFESEDETIEFIEKGKGVNKSSSFEQSLEFDWLNWSNPDRKSLAELYASSACGMVVIHQEETGLCWIWGLNAADPTEKVKYVVRVDSSERKTGKKLEDANVATIKLMAKNRVQAAQFTAGWAAVPLV